LRGAGQSRGFSPTPLFPPLHRPRLKRGPLASRSTAASPGGMRIAAPLMMSLAVAHTTHSFSNGRTREWCCIVSPLHVPHLHCTAHEKERKEGVRRVGGQARKSHHSFSRRDTVQRTRTVENTEILPLSRPTQTKSSVSPFVSKKKQVVLLTEHGSNVREAIGGALIEVTGIERAPSRSAPHSSRPHLDLEEF
jgi:hypothetical protein